MNMANGYVEDKRSWHMGPVQIGYTMLGFRYVIPSKALNCNDIMHAIASQCGLTVAEIKGNRRSATVARPRQLAMLMARESLPNLSLPQIAKRFHRDHTTIMHGIKAARKRLEWDEAYYDLYLGACETLGIHRAPQRVEPTMQTCMFCRKDFLSEGPHHRLCDDQSCKRTRAKQSSSLEFEPWGSHFG